MNKKFEKTGRRLKQARSKAISWLCMIAMVVSIFAFLPPRYADAAATTFTVKYNANGGTGTMADQIITHGVSTNLRLNSFVRSGYDYDCWFGKRGSDNKWRYQSADGATTGWYTEGSQPSGWSKFRFKDGGTVSATVPAGDTVTFYAQWLVATTYTVKFNANGGTGTMANQIITHGVSTNLRLNSFVRSGYDYDCWFGKRDSDNRWRYQSADGTSTGWYTEGSQPSGWSKFRFKNGGTVSTTVPAGNTEPFTPSGKSPLPIQSNSMQTAEQAQWQIKL